MRLGRGLGNPVIERRKHDPSPRFGGMGLGWQEACLTASSVS